MQHQLTKVILLLFFSSFLSCEKDKYREQITRVADSVTIKVNESYSRSLNPFCDECGSIISRQAIHYDTSKIVLIDDSDRYFYYYTPARDYIGTDEVEIKESSGSDGSSPNNIIKFTTIKFTITN